MDVTLMYIDRSILQEYPHEGRFLRIAPPDESLPLEEQRDTLEVVLTTRCDITEAGHTQYSNFVSASFAVFFPFNKDKEEITVKRGDIFESNQYGLLVNGKVVGVFPSQLGGCVAYINDSDV
jgi:hypothetical protein